MKSISSIVEETLLKKKVKKSSKAKESDESELEFKILFDIVYSKSFKKSKSIFIKKYILDILALSLGNVRRASAIANIDRRHMHRLLNEHHVNPQENRQDPLKFSNYLNNNFRNIVDDKIEEMNISGKKLQNIYSNLHDLTLMIANNHDNPATFKEAIDIFEKNFIEKALLENDFDMKKTSKFLKISTRTLYRKIKELNISSS